MVSPLLIPTSLPTFVKYFLFGLHIAKGHMFSHCPFYLIVSKYCYCIVFHSVHLGLGQIT